MWNKTNIALALLLAFVVFAIFFTKTDYAITNYEFLPDMKRSQAYGAYSKNPHFANGRTLQLPVQGTIARGEQLLHYQATAAEAIRAGNELKNPTSVKPKLKAASLERGTEIYRVFCISCHGATGAGDGIVPKYGFPPPPSLLTGKSLKMKDGQLFHILSYGQGNMTDFNAQLSHQQRWDVINYIRTMQKSATSQTKPAVPSKKEPVKKQHLEK
ncbi:hypothetical protein MNBD_PLANCTO02-2881 [hydrothermal vent metagenome]|uniref:Cytochrome c domain-containing protein n=1 Tax=hydrothermal vent metagenome TaxID=652676 RepID=A0A3B1DXC4_9ZZZZ